MYWMPGRWEAVQSVPAQGISMSDYDREYEAFRIFEQISQQDASGQEGLSEKIKPREVPGEGMSLSENAREGTRRSFRPDGPSRPEDPDGSSRDTIRFVEEAPYYEIEYDSCPMPGVGRFVRRQADARSGNAVKSGGQARSILSGSGAGALKIEAPVRDEVRERFNQMRDIARKNQYLYYENSRFYDRKIRQENARIFYEQGMFMKDFEDHYEKEVPFSSYFPSYQAMGYDQLRTYFTWRTRVRQGEIRETSLSYAFLYLYELLNQIGVSDPRDGLEKLMDFWLKARGRQGALGKYVLRWLKDYHIYYELPWSFEEFIARNALESYYPELSDQEDRFESLCAISRYDLRKSSFYQEERRELVRECFGFVWQRLGERFGEKGLSLEEMIFQPAQNMPVWTPFKDALFYEPGSGRAFADPYDLNLEESPVSGDADDRKRKRQVTLSKREVYLYRDGRWTFYKTLTTESGRRLLGCVMKQMEAGLRKAVSFKYKLSPGKPEPAMEETLLRAGIDLEKEVAAATLEFYREATKTVVSVNPDRLKQIRREAMMTQERLAVPEEEEAPGWRMQESPRQNPRQAQIQEDGERSHTVLTVRSPQADISADPPRQESPWTDLKNALTDTEREALLLIWKKEADVKQFADRCGVMLEVLAEGINEKAMDHLGDALLDGEMCIYEDYLEQVAEMLSAGR